jgi:protein-S-isoprenylcysteine O-methyltransferase Ste14
MVLALLIYFALFFAAAFVWPTLRLWHREHVNALVLPRDDTAHGIIATWFRVLIAAIFGILAALTLGLPVEALGPLTWLDVSTASIVGGALLAVSLVWIVLAQAHMGQSWRIGIDTGSHPPLVRSGLFGRSRNPIFLGMRLNLAGLLLVLPNAFTLATLLLGEALIQVQVRLEEAYLSAEFGDAYDAYRRDVPRWL